MRRISTALAALALLASGCSTIVLDPLGGDTSTSSSTGSSGGSGGSGGLGGKSALAMRGSDFGPGSIAWDESDYAPWGGNPNWLVLLFASGPMSCNAPGYSIECEGASRWQTILSIPPELDTPGLVDLQDPRIFVHELTVDVSPSGCGEGKSAGNGFWGTLDIQQSDDTSVTVSLTDSGGTGHPPANGDWVAHRCGPPPAAPPTPAVAFRGTNLPPGGPPNPDPDTLYVVVGTGGPSCTNAYANTACNGSSRLLFSLPPALQKPGKIDLFDPAIAATYTISALDSSAICSNDAGSFSADEQMPNGYLEIQSIDSQQISVRVYKSYTFTEHNLTFEADGHYTASICP